MWAELFQIDLEDENATNAFARHLGTRVDRGDTLLLVGDIGAGKTHFARALIQSLQEVPEDVPSPTFTLIQVYETSKCEILHADLYRLSGPDETAELGLLEALGRDVCLIEWPDRLGSDAPQNALTLSFTLTNGGESRRVQGRGDPEYWATRVHGVSDG